MAKYSLETISFGDPKFDKDYNINSTSKDVFNDYYNDNADYLARQFWRTSNKYKRKFNKLENDLLNGKITENDYFKLSDELDNNISNKYYRRARKNARNWFNENYGNDIDDAFNAMRYVDSYYNSLGYKNRANNFVYPKAGLYDTDEAARIRFNTIDRNQHSMMDDDGTSAVIDIALGNKQNMNDIYGYTPDTYWTAAHEYAHYKDSQLHGNYGAGYPTEYRNVLGQRHQPNYNPNLNPIDADNAYYGHDSSDNENYADLVATRANMYRAGIINSKNPYKRLTLRKLNKYRNSRYSLQDRFLQMYNDEDIIKTYNDLAYNNTLNNIYYG